MTTTQKPLALKLAEAVKTHEHHPQYKFYGMVSDELRRLHDRVQELEAREPVYTWTGTEADDAMILLGRMDDSLDRERIDQLEKIVPRLAARIASLTTQLEAIGAGGVESLRKKGA